jgi:DNA-binding MarR family transcriptional regulator
MPTQNLRKKTAAGAAKPYPEGLDSSALEKLVGYNARRVWITVAALFAERMAPYGLRPVDYSVLLLLAYTPGATSRQLCATLAIQPPNLVKLIAAMDSRGLIERRPHPSDGRAIGLYLTPAGRKLVHESEPAVTQLELDASARLSAAERKRLIGLLQKIYR